MLSEADKIYQFAFCLFVLVHALLLQCFSYVFYFLKKENLVTKLFWMVLNVSRAAALCY